MIKKTTKKQQDKDLPDPAPIQIEIKKLQEKDNEAQFEQYLLHSDEIVQLTGSEKKYQKCSEHQKKQQIYQNTHHQSFNHLPENSQYQAYSGDIRYQNNKCFKQQQQGDELKQSLQRKLKQKKIFKASDEKKNRQKRKHNKKINNKLKQQSKITQKKDKQNTNQLQKDKNKKNTKYVCQCNNFISQVGNYFSLKKSVYVQQTYDPQLLQQFKQRFYEKVPSKIDLTFISCNPSFAQFWNLFANPQTFKEYLQNKSGVKDMQKIKCYHKHFQFMLHMMKITGNNVILGHTFHQRQKQITSYFYELVYYIEKFAKNVSEIRQFIQSILRKYEKTNNYKLSLESYQSFYKQQKNQIYKQISLKYSIYFKKNMNSQQIKIRIQDQDNLDDFKPKQEANELIKQISTQETWRHQIRNKLQREQQFKIEILKLYKSKISEIQWDAKVKMLYNYFQDKLPSNKRIKEGFPNQEKKLVQILEKFQYSSNLKVELQFSELIKMFCLFDYGLQNQLEFAKQQFILKHASPNQIREQDHKMDYQKFCQIIKQDRKIEYVAQQRNKSDQICQEQRHLLSLNLVSNYAMHIFKSALYLKDFGIEIMGEFCGQDQKSLFEKLLQEE